jgi:hypothetical protein
VSTFATGSIIVTQGILQPAENDQTAIPADKLQKKLSVYPNPATSVVNIRYAAELPGTMTYRLTDLNGKLLRTHSLPVSGSTTNDQVNVSDLAAASYMLDVMVEQEGTQVQHIAYKIEKLK